MNKMKMRGALVAVFVLICIIWGCEGQTESKTPPPTTTPWGDGVDSLHHHHQTSCGYYQYKCSKYAIRNWCDWYCLRWGYWWGWRYCEKWDTRCRTYRGRCERYDTVLCKCPLITGTEDCVPVGSTVTGSTSTTTSSSSSSSSTSTSTTSSTSTSTSSASTASTPSTTPSTTTSTESATNQMAEEP